MCVCVCVCVRACVCVSVCVSVSVSVCVNPLTYIINKTPKEYITFIINKNIIIIQSKQEMTFVTRSYTNQNILRTLQLAG